MAKSYHEQVDINNIKKLRELISDLPSFVALFFRGIEQETATRTRIAYAYDLHVFFDYLMQEHPDFKGKTIDQIHVTMLDRIQPVDLEAYMDYLKYYNSDTSDVFGQPDHIERVNQEVGINWVKEDYAQGGDAEEDETPRKSGKVGCHAGLRMEG